MHSRPSSFGSSPFRLLAVRQSPRRVLLTLSLGLLSVHGPAKAATVDLWIDPGHGGVATGAAGFDQVSPYPEKQATLEVASKLLSVLGQSGYSAFMTRYADEDVPLEKRAGMASGTESNSAAEQGTCQLFISIHMNSAKSSQALGTEMYYSPVKVNLKQKTAFRTDSSWAQAIYARLIQNTPAAFMGCNNPRGVKVAKHIVTKEATVPSTLIEVCFISNQCQQSHIRLAGNQGLVASGIASGVSDVIIPGGVPAGPERVVVDGLAPVANPRPWVRESAEGGGTYRVASVESFGEGFDGTLFPPTGWTVTSLGQPAPFFWARSADPIYIHGGSGAALVGGGSAGAIDEWLISPTFLLGPSDHGLSFFWLGNKRWASQVNDQCLIRPVGTSTWTTLWTIQTEVPGQEFEYRQRAVDVTPWIGDSVQIAFRAVGTSGADFAVDDVVVGNFAPLPVPPSNEICASAIPLPARSFNFSGSTCNAANDVDPYRANSLSCSVSPLSGGDVFYSVNATAGDTIDVNVAANWQAAAYIITACDTVEASCKAASPENDLTDTSSVATLSYVFPSSATYYLAVDGIAGDCGEFHLTGLFHGPNVGVEPEQSPVGDAVTLLASPNPFRSGVTVAGTVPRGGAASRGKITVFDAAGRRIWEADVGVAGGRFHVVWDGRTISGARAPSGAYLLRFEYGTIAARAPAVLIQ